MIEFYDPRTGGAGGDMLTEPVLDGLTRMLHVIAFLSRIVRFVRPSFFHSAVLGTMDLPMHSAGCHVDLL